MSPQGRQARDMQFFPSKCSKGDFEDFGISFSKTNWNSPEKPVKKSNSKKATETKAPHSWYSYFATIVDHYYGRIIEGP